MIATVFSDDYYLAANPDVAEAVRAGVIASGYEHYVRYGLHEGRSPNPYFQPAYYLVNNPDVAAAVTAGVFGSAWEHFIAYGAGEGRAPAGAFARFDADAYLAANPDVAAAVAAGILPNALSHYLLAGLGEGRPAYVHGFDAEAYLAANPDVAAAVADGIIATVEHWLFYGHGEGRPGAFPDDPSPARAGGGSGKGPGNSPPTAIALDGSAVEPGALGFAIGALSVEDPDGRDNHTLAVAGDDRFEIAGGVLKLKDDAALGPADATASLTVTATDSAGASVSESFTVGVGFLTAGSGADVLRAPDTGATLRGGGGVDAMYGGAGDDVFVIVGDNSAGGKVDSLATTAALGFPISLLNGRDLDEDAAGGAEIINGGGGTNTLHVIGAADLTRTAIVDIQHVYIHSDVVLGVDQLAEFLTLTGDGSSTLRIRSDTPVTFRLDDAVQLAFIGHIDLGENVTLEIGSLSQLGGARLLTGSGTLATTSDLGPMAGYILTSELVVVGSTPTAATRMDTVDREPDASGVISGTAGNDYLQGTAYADILDGLDGDDVLIGFGGTDTYRISGTGTKTLIDSGRDGVLDLSRAAGPAEIDLAVGGTVNGGAAAGGTTIALGAGTGAVTRQPLDVMFAQDLSGSFWDDLEIMQSAGFIDGVIDGLRAVQPDTAFGVGTYVDKPIYPFGDPAEDYEYRTDAPLSLGPQILRDAYASMVIRSGSDGPESQLTALQQIGLRAFDPLADLADGGVDMDGTGVGYRPNALRTLVLLTDADYHQAGDFASAPTNNGDRILDGTPPGTGEDYPSVDQVKAALGGAGIFPIFAVTRWDKPYYEDLVAQLGIGSVVELSADSSNLVEALTLALEGYQADFIQTLVGTAFADVLIGNSLDNVIYGLGGSNILSGGAGTNVLVGDEEGVDEAVFEYSRADYSFSTVPLESFPVVPQMGTGSCGYGLRVEGTGPSRDGVTYLTSTIDSVRFEGDGVTVPIADLFDTLDIPDAWLEVFAREVAYDLDIGGAGALSLDPFLDDYPWLCSYRIDATFRNTGTSDYARPWLGLEGVGLVSDIAPPVLAFRGTAQLPDDALADLHPTAVGWDQLEESRPDIVDWLASVEEPYITGHSLGGALAQQAAVAFMQDSDGDLGGVVTFNAPGISAAQADAFDAARVTGRVHHHIAAGDVVSLAGQSYIAGEWTQYIYDSPLFFWDFLLDKHTSDLLQGADVPADLATRSFASTADLSSDIFSPYAAIPVDYFMFVLQVSGALGALGALAGAPKLGWQVGSWAAETLSTRGEAESARSDIGLVVGGVLSVPGMVADAVAFILDATGKGIEYLIGGAAAVWEILVDAAKAFGDAIDWIAQTVGEWVAAGTTAAWDFANAVADWGAETWGALMELGLGALDKVEAFWDATTDLVADGFDALTSFVGHLGDLTYEALQSLKGAAAEAWETLLGWGAEVWEDAVSWGAETWATVATWSAETWAAAAGWAAGAWQSLGDMTGEALASVRNLGADVAQGLAELGDAAWESAVSFLEATADLVDDVSDAGKAVLDWFRKILPFGNPWTVEEATHLAEHGWLGFDYEMKDAAETLYAAAQAGADFLEEAGEITHLGLGGELAGVLQTRAQGSDAATDVIQLAGLMSADSLVFDFEPGLGGDRLDFWSAAALGEDASGWAYDTARAQILDAEGRPLVSFASSPVGVMAQIEEGPNRGVEIGLVGVMLNELAAENFA